MTNPKKVAELQHENGTKVDIYAMWSESQNRYMFDIRSDDRLRSTDLKELMIVFLEDCFEQKVDMFEMIDVESIDVLH